MRELDSGVADAMRTSSQIEVETENYDFDFSDVINQTPVEEAEAVVESASESDAVDEYIKHFTGCFICKNYKPFGEDDQAPEFGQSNPNHLEEPPQRENSEADQPKVKQINIHIDLDLYKLLVPAAAITGLAILALGYRKQDKLINGLKAIKNQLKSTKKD